MSIPKLTPEQLEKAARALSKRKGQDPDAMIVDPRVRLMDGEEGYKHPAWTYHTARIEDVCDVLAVLAEVIR